MKDATQLRIPRLFGGCDWGAGFKVLALIGSERLLFSAPCTGRATEPSAALAWHLSRKEWVGLIEGYQRQPARLVLFTIGVGDNSACEVELSSGGRLSAKLLERFSTEIAGVFGDEAAVLVAPGDTVRLAGSASGASG